MGYSGGSLKREVHSNTGLPQEAKSEMNNLILQIKELEKGQEKPRVGRRKEIIKEENK